MTTQKTIGTLLAVAGVLALISCEPTNHGRYKHTKAQRFYFSNGMLMPSSDTVEATVTLSETDHVVIDSVGVK